ncbi:MAG TPA: type II toxin-antitoxin system RelE/ParE family toxin [Tepidisphaeraceae bacterium]|jgi:hypothetical protein|nr:type II toxin-antitoxin system RelE/ParE family toxin [Tepidisphaeraceae bacterium]
MKDDILAAKFAFAKAAEVELAEVIAYYNAEKPGLGDEFADAVDKAIQEVVEHPHRWTIILDDKRRYRLERFPYGLVYKIVSAKIFFLAVMHLHRDPNYWKDREKEV